jgi:hypothetical protein
MKLEFSQQFFINNQVLNFMKIRPVGAEFFYADGRADMTRLTVAFVILRTGLQNGTNLFFDFISHPFFLYVFTYVYFEEQV